MENRDLNAYVSDIDSFVTGNGSHDRVVAFWPKDGMLEARIDHYLALGMPSENQINSVIRHSGIPGKWVVLDSEHVPERGVTYVTLTRHKSDMARFSRY